MGGKFELDCVSGIYVSIAKPNDVRRWLATVITVQHGRLMSETSGFPVSNWILTNVSRSPAGVSISISVFGVSSSLIMNPHSQNT